MATDDSVISDPWSVFAEPIDDGQSQSHQCDNVVMPNLELLWTNDRRTSDGKWRWMCDVCDVVDSGYDAELGDSIGSITVNLRFTASEYSICLKRSMDFPDTAPHVDSTLGHAFEIEWKKDSSLLAICAEYAEFCSLFDTALVECAQVEYPFKFIEWKLHPEEADCITVELDFISDELKKEVRLTLVVEWHSPRSFPRSLNCSEPSLLRLIPFDRWDPSLTFGESLGRLFLHQEDTDEGSLQSFS